jgi:hypothetical protein
VQAVRPLGDAFWLAAGGWASPVREGQWLESLGRPVKGSQAGPSHMPSLSRGMRGAAAARPLQKCARSGARAALGTQRRRPRALQGGELPSPRSALPLPWEALGGLSCPAAPTESCTCCCRTAGQPRPKRAMRGKERRPSGPPAHLGVQHHSAHDAGVPHGQAQVVQGLLRPARRT